MVTVFELLDSQNNSILNSPFSLQGNLKRKHDIDTSPSGSSPSHKSRKTNESLDSRSRSPQDPIQKLQKQSGHQKDKKKLHHVSKYPEKDSSGKVSVYYAYSCVYSYIVWLYHIPRFISLCVLILMYVCFQREKKVWDHQRKEYQM